MTYRTTDQGDLFAPARTVPAGPLRPAVDQADPLELLADLQPDQPHTPELPTRTPHAPVWPR